jgi:hypothetical protein
MLFRALRRLVNRWDRHSGAAPARHLAPRFRPRLEGLEDRNLLSTYIVDHLADDMVGSELTGSLRYCITQAADNDHITFGVTGTINLTATLPVTHGISIEGPGASLLTIAGGYDIDNSGGLILSDCTVSGLFNRQSGTGMLITNCTVGFIGNANYLQMSDCTVGHIDTGGLASVDRCTITDGLGGGIFDSTVDNEGTLTLSNSTISGNTATYGTIIFNNTNSHLTISSCTISGNISWPWIGFPPSSILYNSDSGAFGHGTVDIENTILAGNFPDDQIDDPGRWVRYLDQNLIGGDPELGPLQDNGGPTFTMAPLPGSPALNHGTRFDMPTDQRGVVRTVPTNIGAYQASASVLTLTGVPSSTVAGTPLSATLTVKDSFGQTAVGYTGTVHFSSTDGQAALPADYPFTLGDGGVHIFSTGVTLKTAGPQAVTATDTVTGSITGSAAVTVTPAAADHLLFLQQPTDTAAGQTMGAVVVAVVDQYGNIETGDNSDTITLSIGVNPSGGTFSGTLTVTVVNGVATFTDLSIDLAGTGYTLHATTTGLAGADSGAFSITA